MDASSWRFHDSVLRRVSIEEEQGMNSEIVLTGAIVDSWVERAGTEGEGSRLVLQVAPRGRPRDLMIIEAEPSLLPDRGWLEDLGENLCHGSVVAAVGRLTLGGFITATQLQIAR